jgi:hypothetical protein
MLPLLVIAALGTIVPAGESSEVHPLTLSDQVTRLGPDAIAILKRAERVEVFRLDQSKFPWGNSREFPRFAVLSTGKTQGRKFAARLAALLLDEKSYSAEGKFCEPNPGVAFQLWKGKQHVYVTLCFECNMLAVNSKVGGNFDFVRPELVRLAKEAFPDDSLIQNLRERRGSATAPSPPPPPPAIDPKCR